MFVAPILTEVAQDAEELVKRTPHSTTVDAMLCLIVLAALLGIGVVIGIAVSEWMRSSYALTPAARPLSVPASAKYVVVHRTPRP